MATVPHVNLRPEGYQGDDVILARWTPLTTANADGDYITIPRHADVTVHVFGTFGASTPKVAMQGSNEVVAAPTAPITLLDNANAVVEFTAAGMKQIVNPGFRLRPLFTGGDGTSSLTVIALARRKGY